MKQTYTQLKKNWELKIRKYELMGSATPPLRQIRSNHKSDNHLLYLDVDKNENRELRFSTGKSPFIDEQPKKNVIVEHIFLTEGMLITTRDQISLQQFLAIHPDNVDNGGIIFREQRPEQEAIEETIDFETRADAYGVVKELDAEGIAAYMYSEIGEQVYRTSTKELKRDLYVIADESPEHIISMSKSDNVKLKYIASKAIKFEVLITADEGRTVKWGSNKRKLITVAVDKSPVEALVAFFNTDDGVEVKAKIIELLKKF